LSLLACVHFDDACMLRDCLCRNCPANTICSSINDILGAVEQQV